jgi:hypothetical protein
LAVGGVGAVNAARPLGQNVQVAGLDPARLQETWRNLEAAGLTQSSIHSYLEEVPGVPLALPETLPEGFEWSGPDETYSPTEGGPVTMRSSLFRPDDLSAASAVWICLQEGGTDACPEGQVQIHRTVGAFDVRIVFGDEVVQGSDLYNFWNEVSLTTNVQSVGWLPR